MVLFPVLVVVLNGMFAFVVFRQFLARKKPHQLVWAAALFLGFLAAAFYLVFLASSDSPAMFRLYYICGGLLMAAYLGLGSAYLHLPRRVADAITTLLVILSIIGAVLLFTVHLDPNHLHSAAKSVGPGTNALAPGTWKAFVATLNSFGALAVVAGAVWSGWRTLHRHAPLRFLWANVLIAGGTLIAGAAGVVADQGAFPGAFWAVLAAGFVVLFLGFVIASTPARVSEGA